MAFWGHFRFLYVWQSSRLWWASLPGSQVTRLRYEPNCLHGLVLKIILYTPPPESRVVLGVVARLIKKTDFVVWVSAAVGILAFSVCESPSVYGLA